MLQRIKLHTESVYPKVVKHYRHLHAHPELSYQEYKTAEYVKRELDSLKIPYRADIGGTGILGRIAGKNPSKKIIALRADMDALPIQEAVDIPHRSVNDNVMHACGHDAHTACLLGAAEILNKLKDAFEGTILLIFQPGEELAPGGANLMLRDGIFDEFKPEIIIGQHVSEDYPTGSIAVREGTIMASADEIHLTIRGKGGHGAKPHLCNDTVLAAGQTIVALQQVRSRLCPPLVPMVLTFGKLIANGATNVIPDEVKLSGTFRTFDENWRGEAKIHIPRIIEKTCEAFGCTVEINMPDGYPCVVNHSEVTREVRLFAEEFLGWENVLDFDQRLTSEDFGFFSQLYPSCFYRFGIKGENFTGNSHSPTFRVDEKALQTGVSGLAWIAYRFMTEKRH
ncbi:MAG: M20 family metallopeptidase [Paludibacteraceae bacterium]